jgi:hypothetical protein
MSNQRIQVPFQNIQPKLLNRIHYTRKVIKVIGKLILRIKTKGMFTNGGTLAGWGGS